MTTPLPKLFQSFLEKAEADSWITSFRWYQSNSFPTLKAQMPSERAPEVSRTHKKSADHQWWGLEITAAENSAVGVDLEILIDRPILRHPAWLQERFGFSSGLSGQGIMEEWVLRESSFKALWPHNEGALLSHFQRQGAKGFVIQHRQKEYAFQTRHTWKENWLLALSWRNTSV